MVVIIAKNRLIKLVLVSVLVLPLFFLLFHAQILNWFNTSHQSWDNAEWWRLWFEFEFSGTIDEKRLVDASFNSELEIFYEPFMTYTHIVSDGANSFEIEDEAMTFGARPGTQSLSSRILPEYWQFETPQDLFYIEVWNHTQTAEMPLLLKLFYNYKEVEFKVVGSDGYKTEFIFMVPPSYRVFIPINLTSDLQIGEGGSRLGAAVFLHPEQHTYENTHIVWRFNHNMRMFLDFEIQYRERDDIFLSAVSESSERLNQFLSPFPGYFMVNADGLGSDRNDMDPIELIQVSTGERVDLSFVGNPNHESEPGLIDEFLIIALLDWQQVPINSQPFLFFNQDPNVRNIVFYDEFYIYAPDEPGLYEFVSIMVTNPRERRNVDNFRPQRVSIRFTIEVLDEGGEG